ncbi:hypothetical protein GCM10009689_09210 [Brevibacterium antiquum]
MQPRGGETLWTAGEGARGQPGSVLNGAQPARDFPTLQPRTLHLGLRHGLRAETRVRHLYLRR